MKEPIRRLLGVPTRSFFLFGPRGTGKSTWLRSVLQGAAFLDLLDTSLSLELTRNPHRLEALIVARHPGSWIVLDEIQKIPALLDEVHRLMETQRWKFALCGSSARKLRRGGADLLAGRASTVNMEGFSSAELGSRFDVKTAMEWGTLPQVWQEPAARQAILSAYVHTYIQEEVKAEGLIRQAAPFLRFLAVAGLMNGQMVNASNLAREAGVPRASVETYFSILVDTLVGHFLPTWQPRLKVRERSHPKFYWFDPGVARAAAGLLSDPVDRSWRGFALETLVFHELRVYNETKARFRPLSYYRTAAGAEIDFVIETRKGQTQTPPHVVLVEIKSADRWDRTWERAMRGLAADPRVRVERMFGVYAGDRRYRFDGVEVLPVPDFLQLLNAGGVF